MKKRIYVLSIILFIVDLFIKLLVRNTMTLNESVNVIPNFFSITYVINDGAAFSILSGKQLFLIILSIIVLIYIIKLLNKDKLNFYKEIYYSLLVGGIFGNLYDRIIYRGVIDYFDFKIFSYDAPIFNLADSFIVIAVFFIIIESIRKELHENRSNW